MSERRHTRIKICGITRPQDAIAAEAAGCDAIGLVFRTDSARFVTLEQAAAIVASVSPLVTAVGVFVSPTIEQVLDTADRTGITAAQLCGQLDDCSWSDVGTSLRLIRSVRMNDSPPDPKERMEGVDDYLFDTAHDVTFGGTGRAFDWRLLRDQPAWGRTWLAGGLDAGNVARAIAMLKPYAVDVSTGVEDSPGVKSPEKIQAFVSAVRAADRELE